MRYGTGMPVTTQTPGMTPAWEATASVDDVVAVAQACDRAGFAHVTTSHHIAVPGPGVDPYSTTHGAHFWDPAVTFGFLGAHTTRLRFLTYAYVIGLAHPLELAKSFGTADLVTGGRVTLGLGVGNFEPEFATLGRSFADRGARADDALRALRAITGKRIATYHGSHFDFEGYVVSPHSVQEPMPMWIAGHTARALRRAVELGDGWMPTPASHGGPSDDDIRRMMARHDVPAGFELLLSLGEPLDPAGDPGGTRAQLDALEAGPATIANVRFAHTSRAHLVEQIEAFAALAGLAG
jgi:probable F420-dependent oxidoreductase